MMGLCRKQLINQNLFDFKHENDQWWRITESNHRITKFISIDISDMDWLATALGACVFVGSSEFYKTRRKGSQVLVLQICHNSYVQICHNSYVQYLIMLENEARSHCCPRRFEV